MSKSIPPTDPLNPAVGRPGILGGEDLQLAHALRTPLTALKSALDLLCAADLEAEDEHIVHLAQRNADRIVEVVEALLLHKGLES
jgi:nitrogen-specific signal transduction histidine kinase